MRAVPTSGIVLADDQRRRSREGHPSGSALRRKLAALTTVPLFDALSKRHLRHLAGEADVVGFDPGHPIVREGEAGEAMFVVLSGTARVERRSRKLAVLMPGDFFGELSALDGGPRTASVVPETPIEVLRIFRHTLHGMIRHEPGLSMALLEGVARRLRHVLPGRPDV